MKAVNEINESQFEKEVLQVDKPVVVDFYAPWCGPCRMLAPVLESIAAEYQNQAKFVKVNVDEALVLSSKYGIKGVPTILIFKDGKPVDGFVGFARAGDIKAKLDPLVEEARDSGGSGCCCSCW